jgi:metal-responsive CopG/Arc/MetJ family transcriptional regulator
MRPSVMRVCYDAVMKRVTITMPDPVYEQLCVEARRRGLSISEVIREKLDSYFAERRSRLPRFVGLAEVRLPYTAAQVDEELAKTFGRD